MNSIKILPCRANRHDRSIFSSLWHLRLSALWEPWSRLPFRFHFDLIWTCCSAWFRLNYNLIFNLCAAAGFRINLDLISTYWELIASTQFQLNFNSQLQYNVQLNFNVKFKTWISEFKKCMNFENVKLWNCELMKVVFLCFW